MTTFEAPGAGQWDLDRSHYESGMTRISAKVMGDGSRNAYRKLFAEMGMPAETMDMRTVHGFSYIRIRPLVGADVNVNHPPPTVAIKLLARLHPEFRRRAKRAEATLQDSGFALVVDEWRNEIKPRLIAQNLEFQSHDLGSMTDDELADQLGSLYRLLQDRYEEHHRLHGYDLGPIGLFVVAGRSWGFASDELLDALAGASPSTIEPLNSLAAIRDEIDAAGAGPTSLDDVRAVSDEARRLLDAYLEYHGSMLYSSYDIDTPTLGERPDVVLATILAARRPQNLTERAAEVAAELRDRVPNDERSTFDEYLADARAAMDMRDDNGPITVEWPAGLLRLAMLEAGRRLVKTGHLHDESHIFEVDGVQLAPLMRTGTGPSADELARRSAEREADRQLEPPATLGTAEKPPPLSALPKPMATLVEMVSTLLGGLGMAPRADDATDDDPSMVHGTGIGTERFTGVARTAETAEAAISEMEDDEILVTRTTSPAYNLVLSIAGGLVTAEGGPMCHAAVLSRELSLPAVIGTGTCLERIKTGDRLEIDPVAGTVRILD